MEPNTEILYGILLRSDEWPKLVGLAIWPDNREKQVAMFRDRVETVMGYYVSPKSEADKWIKAMLKVVDYEAMIQAIWAEVKK